MGSSQTRHFRLTRHLISAIGMPMCLQQDTHGNKRRLNRACDISRSLSTGLTLEMNAERASFLPVVGQCTHLHVARRNIPVGDKAAGIGKVYQERAVQSIAGCSELDLLHLSYPWLG